MRLIWDTLGWAFFFFLFLSGAFRNAFDGAFFAYFRPAFEQIKEQLPEIIQYLL